MNSNISRMNTYSQKMPPFLAVSLSLLRSARVWKKIIFGSIRIQSDCGKLLLWGNFRLWKCHYVLFIQDSCHGWKSLSNGVQTFGFQVLCQFFKGQNKHKLTTLNKNNSIWIKRWHKDFEIHKKLYWIIII